VDVNDPRNVWTDAGDGYFVNQTGHRARSHNLPCIFGGSKHTYDSWGLDVTNFGDAGYRTCEVWVCSNLNCRRTKVKRVAEAYCRTCRLGLARGRFPRLRSLLRLSPWIHPVKPPLPHRVAPNSTARDLIKAGA
jgi:hypothetical protein